MSAAQRLGTVLMMAGAAAGQPNGELAGLDALEMAQPWLDANEDNPLAVEELLAEAVKVVAAAYRALLAMTQPCPEGECWNCTASTLLLAGGAVFNGDPEALRVVGLPDETGM